VIPERISKKLLDRKLGAERVRKESYLLIPTGSSINNETSVFELISNVQITSDFWRTFVVVPLVFAWSWMFTGVAKAS
jgi:hypothetical protein